MMKLSIITINYNNKAGLQKTIDSVICQTWKGYEWIIIDGGSTDGSKDLIEKYQEYFVFWCSEPDKGVYDAMNKGIAKAKGEYLNFMNSGDCYYDKDTLDNVFQLNLYGDVVYGNCIKIDKGNKIIWNFPHQVDLEFFYSNNLCHQSMFIKNSILQIEGYDDNYKIYGDWARWLKLALNGGTFQFIPKIICNYEVGGLSCVSKETIIEYKKMINDLPISTNLKEIIICNHENKGRLQEYEECYLTRVTLFLIKDCPLYSKLIYLNLLFLRGLRKILFFLEKKSCS